MLKVINVIYNTMDVIHEVTKDSNFKGPNEYKINRHLSLKLENDRTIVYVNGKRFRNCKYLLLNFNEETNDNFGGIDSIDEVAEILNHDLHGNFTKNSKISPKEEFWGHCSNLQAWAENDYDSRLLHSNLSFPLLKRLAKEGDPQAKRVFKEEIVKRIESEYQNVVHYLIKEGYLEHLEREELVYLKNSIKNFEITKIIGKFFFNKELFDFSALFLERTLKLHPSDKESQELLREIYETDEEKIARYLKILEKDPNRKKLKAKLIELYNERKEFNSALNILDSDIATEYTRETHELIKAIKQIENESESEQLELWNRVCTKLIQIIIIHSNPVLSRYIYNPRERTYRVKVLSKEVVYFSKKALEIKPSNLKFKEHLGKIFYLLERYDEAINIYEQLIESNSHNRDYKFKLGKLYIKIKKYGKAINVLKEFEWDTIKSLNFENIFKREEYKFYLFSFWKAIGSFFYQEENYYKASEIFRDLLDFNTESFFLRTVQEVSVLNRLIKCYRKTNQIDQIYELMDMELSEYGQKNDFPTNYTKLIKKYSQE
jgi:tetratricopeptide (TPR) repeat protein